MARVVFDVPVDADVATRRDARAETRGLDRRRREQIFQKWKVSGDAAGRGPRRRARARRRRDDVDVIVRRGRGVGVVGGIERDGG